ncbi:MYND-type zinc finger protein mub1 [Dionaea muscipula]
MSMKQDQLEIKFRLTDGTDMGPRRYHDSTTITTLKESIIAQWPKDKENAPKTVKDIKLISAGRVLDNSKMVGDCRIPLSDVLDTVMTMHVVVQPPTLQKDKKAENQLKQNKCVCVIL